MFSVKVKNLERVLCSIVHIWNVLSVQVDVSGTADATAKNEELEFERNQERFLFLKWGAKVISETTTFTAESKLK